jgi:hypothetical protein
MRTQVNDDAPPDGSGESSDLPITDGLRAALTLLRRALDCARDAQADPWDFALEVGELYAAGLTITDFRWMVAKGLVEHADEVSLHGFKHRSFKSSCGFTFLPSTCALLTRKGAALAAQNTAHVDKIPEVNGNSHQRSAIKPRWDAARRELYLGDRMVKRFHVPARNQELVLSAFEDSDWSELIDDPLADEFDIDPKIRLNDVVYRLNQKQIVSLIRFHASGHGRSVCWSLRSPQRPNAAADSIAATETRVIDVRLTGD